MRVVRGRSWRFGCPRGISVEGFDCEVMEVPEVFLNGGGSSRCGQLQRPGNSPEGTQREDWATVKTTRVAGQ